MLPEPDFGVAEEISMVEERIREVIQSGEALLTEIASYVTQSGGKRIRPVLALLSFKAVGGRDPTEIIDLASAIELVHNATLVHDDINDGGRLRRGLVAAHLKYGMANALVAGDFLFTKGYQLGGKYGAEVVSATAEAFSALAESEILQKKHLFDVDLTEDQYLSIVKKKTAMIFGTAAKVGAIEGGGEEQQVNALFDYGLNLGMAFQITDDILDVIGKRKVLGKETAMDIREGNMTYPSVCALREGNKAKQHRLKEIMAKRAKNESELAEAIQAMQDAGVIQRAKEKSQEYGRKALSYLSVSLEREAREHLVEVVDFVLRRDF